MKKKRTELVLIGPPTAGKSTLGMTLAKMLEREYVSLDSLRNEIFDVLDYNVEKAESLLINYGFEALFEYWRPFECVVLETCINEFKNCVFDVGAGYVIQSQQDLVIRTDSALAPFQHIVKIDFCSDPELSASLMKQRLQKRDRLTQNSQSCAETNMILASMFVGNPAYARYAQHTVYTHQRTVQECAADILANSTS